MIFEGGSTRPLMRVAKDIHLPKNSRLFVWLLVLCLAVCPTTSSLAQRQRPFLRPAARDYLAGEFVLIPRDERPSSLQQPRMLARVADHDLILPPARAMASADK